MPLPAYLRRYAALLGGLLLTATARAQTPSFDLAVAFSRGTTTFASTQPTALAVDAAGNSYVAGYFSGTVIFGSTVLTSAGQSDLFVAKLDPAGNCLWAVKGGGGSYDTARGLVLDGNGSLYVTGYVSGTSASVGGVTITPASYPGNPIGSYDLIVAKLSTSGQWQWVASATGPGYEAGWGLALSRSGTLYLTGDAGPDATFASTTLPNTGSSFVATISPNGTWLSARRIPGYSRKIVLDGADNAYVAGFITSINGQSTTFGSTTLPSSQPDDVYLAKLSPAGQWLWAVSASGPEIETVEGLALDANGDAYLSGTFRSVLLTFGSTQLANAGPTNTTDGYVAKVSAAGQWLWALGLHSPSGDVVRDVVVDAAGGAYLTGNFTSPATFAGTTLSGGVGDILVARLTPNGQCQWMVRGSSGSNTGGKLGYALALHQNGLYVAGYLSGTQVAFGPLTITGIPANTTPGFLARLNTGVLANQAARSAASFQAFPNPARGSVRLNGPRAGQVVQVIDARGRVVAQPRVAPGGTLPLPAAPGLYLLRSGAQICRLAVE